MTTARKDYFQEFLEQKFDGINIKLDNIQAQVTKTNNRVTHLEDQKAEYLKTRVSKDMLDDLEKDVLDIEKKLDQSIQWGHHIVDTRGTECPNAKLIHQVNDDLAILLNERNYRKNQNDTWWKKYQRTIETISIIIAFFTMLTMIISNNVNTSNLKEQVDMINTPVKTRSGAIEFWPSGVVIDSLKK